MSVDHQRFRFSATCHTEDLAVLHCLRALCQFAEQGRKPQIGWGGTGEREWRLNSCKIIFRFTATAYRERFNEEANRLLSKRWRLVAQNDSDPATPQRV